MLSITWSMSQGATETTERMRLLSSVTRKFLGLGSQKFIAQFSPRWPYGSREQDRPISARRSLISGAMIMEIMLSPAL